MSTLWDGLWASLTAAVVSALVAVAVVHLSNRSARRSWYDQRRIEAYERVLDAFGCCWTITSRNWDYYDNSQENIVDTDAIMRLRDQDLIQAETKTVRAIDVWGLYLGKDGVDLLGAARRALDTLSGEWLWSSYLGRGALYIPLLDLCPPDEGTDPVEDSVLSEIPGNVSHTSGEADGENREMSGTDGWPSASPYEQEWENFRELADAWHVNRRLKRKRIERELRSVFRLRHHTVEDVVRSGAKLRFSIE